MPARTAPTMLVTLAAPTATPTACGTPARTSREVRTIRSLPGNSTGDPSGAKKLRHTSPAASCSTASSTGSPVANASRVRTGAPMPRNAPFARPHSPTTCWNAGSSSRVARIAADGSAWANRNAGIAPDRCAAARVISFVWNQGVGSAWPPTVGTSCTPVSGGMPACATSETVRPEDIRTASPGTSPIPSTAVAIGPARSAPRVAWWVTAARCTARSPSTTCRRSARATVSSWKGSTTSIRTSPARRASDTSRLTVGRDTPSRSAISPCVASSR